MTDVPDAITIKGVGGASIILRQKAIWIFYASGFKENGLLSLF